MTQIQSLRAEQSRAEQSRAEQLNGCVRLGNVYNDEKFDGGNFGGNVWDSNGIAPTMKTGASASQQCVVKVEKLFDIPKDVLNDNERQRRVYSADGLSPTVLSRQDSCKILEVIRMNYCECIGGFGEKKSNGGTQWYQQDRVYSMGDVSLYLPSQLPGGSYNYLEINKMEKIGIVAMRGRGENNEQQLEPNSTGCTNTITSATKDNLVLEKKTVKIRQATKQGFIECEIPGLCDLKYPSSENRRGRVLRGGQISPTITTEDIPSLIEFGNEKFYNFLYEIDGELYLIRIRKLTETECGRLMNFSENDIRAMKSVNSKTQVYKQCGNSIVTSCLTAIFSQMFEGKEWNDMSVTERCELIGKGRYVGRKEVL